MQQANSRSTRGRPYDARGHTAKNMPRVWRIRDAHAITRRLIDAANGA
jgi:hypothetical protein